MFFISFDFFAAQKKQKMKNVDGEEAVWEPK
jgi:hypothetical protein